MIAVLMSKKNILREKIDYLLFYVLLKKISLMETSSLPVKGCKI
jgi:hypothetical protein